MIVLRNCGMSSRSLFLCAVMSRRFASFRRKQKLRGRRRLKCVKLGVLRLRVVEVFSAGRVFRVGLVLNSLLGSSRLRRWGWGGGGVSPFFGAWRWRGVGG